MMKLLKRGKLLVFCALLCLLLATVASAAGSGDVASAVESTWTTASTQIKTVVDNVVFPVIDMVLAIAFFVKLGTAYFDYRKSGQFEWTAPALCLSRVHTDRADLHLGHRRTVIPKTACVRSKLRV